MTRQEYIDVVQANYLGAVFDVNFSVEVDSIGNPSLSSWSVPNIQRPSEPVIYQHYLDSIAALDDDGKKELSFGALPPRVLLAICLRASTQWSTLSVARKLRLQNLIDDYTQKAIDELVS